MHWGAHVDVLEKQATISCLEKVASAQWSKNHIFKAFEANKLCFNQEIEKQQKLTLVEEIDKMSSKEKCRFILNGFNISYTSEWQAIYSSVAKFLYEMYNKYQNMIIRPNAE